MGFEDRVVACLIDGWCERGWPCQLDERCELAVSVREGIQATGRGSAGEEVEHSRVLGCGYMFGG
jgi:hypothetical protein